MHYPEKVERVVVITLLIMMALVVCLSTVELGWFIIKDVITPPVFLLEINQLLDILACFYWY